VSALIGERVAALRSAIAERLRELNAFRHRAVPAPQE
jgi:hypothetical protein